MTAIGNGNRGTFNASVTAEGAAPAPRCCARCKTPGFGCANTSCRCHAVAVSPPDVIVYFEDDRGAHFERYERRVNAESRVFNLAVGGHFSVIMPETT